MWRHRTLYAYLEATSLKETTWELIRETVYKRRKRQQKGSIFLQIGSRVHRVCSNLSLCVHRRTDELACFSAGSENHSYSILQVQKHTNVWAILKMKNIQPWKETEVISLLKIITHINDTAVTGIRLSSLREAFATSVESINFSFPNVRIAAWGFAGLGFALCRTHPFHSASSKRTELFFS